MHSRLRTLVMTLATSIPLVAAADDQFVYGLPADIVDFPDAPAKQAQMQARWQQTMDAFVRMGIAGNPWTNHNDAPRANYQDPRVLPAGAAGPVQPITWTAFPNKVAWYFSVSQHNPYQVPTPLLYPLADNGRLDPRDPVLRQWAKQNGVLKNLEALVKRFPAFASTDVSSFAFPVANTTMETYFQGHTCIFCHSTATVAASAEYPDQEFASDYSFVFQMAGPKPASE